MLAAGRAAFLLGEEGGQGGEPFLGASQQVAAGKRVGQLLQALGVGTVEESVGALLERYAFLAQAVGQPVVLVEADAGREREIRTHAHEHAAPPAVVDVEVVLQDPALGDLQVPAAVLRFADSDHDARGLARPEDYYDLIRFGAPEVWCDELVAATSRGFNDRRMPLKRAVLDPTLELRGNPAQEIAADRILLAIGAKEAHRPLRLLEGLNQTVEQDAIEAPIAKADAVLVMLEKGVHGIPRLVDSSKHILWTASAEGRRPASMTSVSLYFPPLRGGVR